MSPPEPFKRLAQLMPRIHVPFMTDSLKTCMAGTRPAMTQFNRGCAMRDDQRSTHPFVVRVRAA
jgi:hypothetical protein